ncbi:MAG: hypothetical protein AAGK37_13270, partial [Pseudomonadota bacterium]
FRAGLIRNAQNGYPIRYGDKRNADGTWFKWFDVRSFPEEPPLVVARGVMGDGGLPAWWSEWREGVVT